MFEKDLTVGFLLDFYGDVLSERKRTVLDYYYNDDGELIREYHFLEDKMMGGPYTVEYLFEAIDDSAG